jgi:hypothetical protein
MTWAKGDAIQTGLASVQARRLLTAFEEVRLADAPEPEAIAAALADLVSSFVASWPDAAREQQMEVFFRLIARMTADKLERRAEAGDESADEGGGAA